MSETTAAGVRRVPRTLLRTSRDEHCGLGLHVLEGAIPPELKGHLFVMAAAGDVESQGLPRRDGLSTTMLAGDGLITRIDFADGAATLHSRLLRTPDGLLEEAIERRRRRGERRPTGSRVVGEFANRGVARFDRIFGARNQVNTALEVLPSDGGPTRMIATWDAGRPWEIDPESLTLETPVGTREQWLTSMGHANPLLHLGFPFPLQFTTAHPGVDHQTGEVFFASWSLNLSRFTNLFKEVHHAEAVGATESAGTRRKARSLLAKTASRLDALGKTLEGVDLLPGRMFDPGMRLLRWDGRDHPTYWELLDASGAPIVLRETCHQVLVTQDWVIFADTGFKVGPSSLFRDVWGPFMPLQKNLRGTMHDTPRLILVRRADLDPSKAAVRAHVIAPDGGFPGNFVHAYADYRTVDDTLRVHLALTPGADVAEWLRPSDTSPFGGAAVPRDLLGCFALGVMDSSRIGTMVIELGDAPKARYFEDPNARLQWGVGLGAAQGQASTAPGPDEGKHTTVYWASVGFWRELYTEAVWSLYEYLPDRWTTLKDIREYAKTGGPPPKLVAHDVEKNEVSQRWYAPDGVFINTPQLIGDRWLALMIWTDRDERDSSGTELWIFERDDLRKGPICRLSHQNWWLGFTMHAAWADSIAKRAAAYRVSAVDELDRFMAGWWWSHGAAGSALRRLGQRWRARPPGAWALEGDEPRLHHDRLRLAARLARERARREFRRLRHRRRRARRG